MEKNAWVPGRGRSSFIGEDPSFFRVLRMDPEFSLSRLTFPALSISVPDTLFFAGKGPEDRCLLEKCLALPLSYLILGGRWPRTLPAALRTRAKESGIRILGPRSEGVCVPGLCGSANGSTVILAEGGEVLAHCLAAFRRRKVPVRYALSFGQSSDYSPLEAAASILRNDDASDFFVFILKDIRDGRAFLDFAASAAEQGKRTALLLLHHPETSVREEIAALKQYRVILLNEIHEIVDGAVAFLSFSDSARLCDKSFSHRVSSDEVAFLLEKEADRAGFVLKPKETVPSPLFLEVVSEFDSLDSVLRRKGRAEQVENISFFTSLEDTPSMEKLALSAKVPFVPGFCRCFGALQLVFGRDSVAHAHTVGETLSTKCPLHPRPTEYDAKVLLRAYNIPVAREFLCHSLPEALTAAETIGYPVALKVMSPSILHKTEARVIALDLRNEEELKNAYGRTLEKARIADPSARIRGVLVQEMVRGGTEWRMEFRRDYRFGPIVETSISGIYGEIFPDGVLRAAPFAEDEALRMIQESKGYPLLLEGWRRERLDIAAFASALAAFSHLAYCENTIERLDINPIFVNPTGVLVVDAFIERRVRMK